MFYFSQENNDPTDTDLSGARGEQTESRITYACAALFIALCVGTVSYAVGLVDDAPPRTEQVTP